MDGNKQRKRMRTILVLISIFLFRLPEPNQNLLDTSGLVAKDLAPQNIPTIFGPDPLDEVEQYTASAAEFFAIGEFSEALACCKCANEALGDLGVRTIPTIVFIELMVARNEVVHSDPNSECDPCLAYTAKMYEFKQAYHEEQKDRRIQYIEGYLAPYSKRAEQIAEILIQQDPY